MHGRIITRLGLMAILFAVLLSLPVLTGCEKKESKTSAERLVNVRVGSAEKKMIRPFIETMGSLKPYEEVTVSSEADGIVKRITVDEGSQVAKGALLAQIKDTDYLLDYQRMEAALKQAQASLANAKQEYQRKEALYKEELVTKQQFDDISTRLVLAEGEVERAQLGRDIAKERLGKTKIYAPLSGMIKDKRVSAGDFIRASMPIVTIIQVNPLKLLFTLAERNVAQLKVGQEVALAIDSYPDREFRGIVRTIYSNLEERSRTLQVEAVIPNTQKMLKPGFFARVTLYTGPPQPAILVPVTSLLYENDKIKVFVVEAGRAKERVVTTGGKYGELMQVTTGLNEGDQVVVVGQQNLAEGLKVNVAR